MNTQLPAGPIARPGEAIGILGGGQLGRMLAMAAAEMGLDVHIFTPEIDSPAARVSAFVDFGNVFKDIDSFDAGELRASAGVALLWRAPVGPISISYAFPLRTEETDELERLQSTFGGAF